MSDLALGSLMGTTWDQVKGHAVPTIQMLASFNIQVFCGLAAP